MKFAAKKALSGRGPLLAIAFAGGALAGASATAFAGADDDRHEPVTAGLDIEHAAGTALKTVPGGHIEGLELSYNGRALIWEVDVLAADGTVRELHIDARDRRVLADDLDPPEEGEDGNDCDDARPADGATGRPGRSAALRSAEITASRAARAALEIVPGTLTSVDFEYHRTVPGWGIDITAKDGREHKLRVDATTGEIVTNAADEDDG